MNKFILFFPSQDQQSYSGSENYKSDVYITHTEEYGEPEEETSVLIDDQGNQKTIKVLLFN